MISSLNKHFDNIYVLNLRKRLDRQKLIAKSMSFCDIKYELFYGIDGAILKSTHRDLVKNASNDVKPFHFLNSNYLACTLSHLAIYKDALDRGFRKILIVEDDCRILRNANKEFEAYADNIGYYDLLYLGFIPLSEDCSRWDYTTIKNKGIIEAKNMWGLYGYGISAHAMKITLDHYDNDIDMELDRYFVNHIQTREKSIAINPQIFAATDGFSDNSGLIETGMMERSIDQRYAKLIDYV